MKKNEAALLTVRILGLILCLNGCRYLFIIFENIMVASGHNEGKILLSKAVGLISGWIIQAIISFLAGLYLLRGGDFIINLLDYEKPPRIGEYKNNNVQSD